MEIEENVPLAPLTTFGIGGVGRFLIRVSIIEELQEALSFAKKKELQVLIIGGGSNMLVPDAGWAGLVIKIEIKGVQFVKEGEHKEQNTEENEDTNNQHIVLAGAGERWDGLVEYSV
ncbi:MAG TPA: FAD-binding protein, partial [Candidatus Paceibacterota bacterium]